MIETLELARSKASATLAARASRLDRDATERCPRDVLRELGLLSLIGAPNAPDAYSYLTNRANARVFRNLLTLASARKQAAYPKN